mmetsp:Transcript_8684/g.25703  ORF Transcript_8684/g.25703 Transcript_8684/m.25703 type:complete len:468 (+) Transcript_8684:1496-2899(+)
MPSPTIGMQNDCTKIAIVMLLQQFFLVARTVASDDVVRESGSEGTADATSSSSSSWVFPLLLSCLAGASTCVGASVVFWCEPSAVRRSMAFSLSLAAAVMITVSVVSILPEVAHSVWQQANDDDERNHPGGTGAGAAVLRTDLVLERLLYFGVGVGAYLLLAKLLTFLPEPEHLYLLDDPGETEDYKRNYDLYLSDDDAGEEESSTVAAVPLLVRRRATQGKRRARRGLDRAASNETLSSLASRTTVETGWDEEPDFDPRNIRNNEDGSGGGGDEDENGEDLAAFSKERRKRSWRVALMLFVSLLIHNFPEGLCVAASAKESPELGITVAIGIFIHNVPEGIAISVPCIVARPDRPWLAFWLASASGLAEPLGAVVALFLLGNAHLDLENVLSFVAGVMITVALWELYPEAIRANREARGQRSGKWLPKSGIRRLFAQLVWHSENRSILWGSIIGAGLMVATELYLV